MLLLYIGAQKQGIFYQRMVYGWLDLFSKIGGLEGLLLKFLKVIAGILTAVPINGMLIKVIVSRFMNQADDYKS
jgi:hypothetical protein